MSIIFSDCPYEFIVDALRDSAVVYEGWSEFAKRLDIPITKILHLKKQLQLELLNELDVYRSILETWRQNKAQSATLQNLLDVFEASGWNNVSGKKIFIRLCKPKLKD